MNEPSQSPSIPLVVDVDGTLLKTDILHEAALQFVARFPFEFYKLGWWLLQGKARLKWKLAESIDPNIETMPLRAETMAALERAHAEGRDIYIASASPKPYIDRLASRIGTIKAAFSSDSEANLAGARKADHLIRQFGKGGYDYIGDAAVDFPVWRGARKVQVVARSAAFEARVKRSFPHAEVIARPRVGWRAYFNALRVHQWAKNVLVFLSLIVGHHFDAPTIATALAAFVCFCLAASSAYIINDLLDIPGDRDHAWKRRRPFAAGELPIGRGLVFAALLMLGAASLASQLSREFGLVLAVYVLLTLGYSLVLKRRAVIDVIALGILYSLRVLGGLVAMTQAQSQWILIFSLFFFLSLALAKRCDELVHRRDSGKPDPIGRGYRIQDCDVLFSFATAAGYAAVLVLALYMSSPEVIALYRNPGRMWLACPILLYWISRLLLIVHRGELGGDPVIFAIKDRVSWASGALMALVIAFAI
jgi:4-hydroxybenzoate polyprenyltransferase